MDDDAELELKINVSSLLDYLSCPVCMGRLRQTHITICGHRYCGECIKECVGQLHRCPCCNGQLSLEDLIKDSQYDALIETVKMEEKEAEIRYFNKLIMSVAPGCPPTNVSKCCGSFSPIEQVLKDHLKRSLCMHESFYKELQRDLKHQQRLVEEDLSQSIERLAVNSDSVEALSQAKARYEEEAASRKAILEAEMLKSAQLLASAYDRYLSEHVPDLSILPITVSISLISKGFRVNDVHLKPQDSIEDIKRIISDKMVQRGDNLVSYGEDVKFLCFSPFAKGSFFELSRIARDVVELGKETSGVKLLPDDCCPVMQCSVRPGSEIAVYGSVKFACDSPPKKICFFKTFNVDEENKMDYFTCISCRTNWICRPCTDICHKDHDVKPYIFGHQPKGACCYCVKKKTCKIQS